MSKAKKADDGKTYHWTKVEYQAPEQNAIKWCHAGTKSVSGPPQFMAQYRDGKWFSNRTGSWTQYEPDVSHYRDCYEAP